MDRSYRALPCCLFTCFVLVLTYGPGRADDYPTCELKTEGLKGVIYLPDPVKGFHCGSRFDWSGVLGHVEFAGHELFTRWLGGVHNPTNFEAILGPVEEFGTAQALGYEEAKVGETFLKIGVGELQKPPEKSYGNLRNYKVVKPGAWTIDCARPAQVRFTQEVRTASGHGYWYEKTIAAESVKQAQGQPPSVRLTIAHRLKNTGVKPLATDVYNHNFFNIDNDPVGSHYELQFPFPVAAAGPRERFNEVIELSGKELRLRKALDTGSVFSELTGFDRTTRAGFTLRHTPSGIRVTVLGTEPLSKFNLWGVSSTLCPEPFHALNLQPGEEKAWTWEYRFEKEG
jgi:hypothetical protein